MSPHLSRVACRQIAPHPSLVPVRTVARSYSHPISECREFPPAPLAVPLRRIVQRAALLAFERLHPFQRARRGLVQSSRRASRPFAVGAARTRRTLGDFGSGEQLRGRRSCRSGRGARRRARRDGARGMRRRRCARTLRLGRRLRCRRGRGRRFGDRRRSARVRRAPPQHRTQERDGVDVALRFANGRRLHFAEQRAQRVEFALDALALTGQIRDRAVELAAQLVPLLAGELAHRRAQFGFRPLIVALGDLTFELGQRLLELRRERMHRSGLGRELLLRLAEACRVIAVHLHEDVTRRSVLSRIELREPLLVLAPLREQHLDFLDLFRARVGHRFALPFTWRAARRRHAAGSRLSLRWCATISDGPTVTAPWYWSSTTSYDLRDSAASSASAREPGCAYSTSGTVPTPYFSSASIGCSTVSPATEKPVATGGWACTTARISGRIAYAAKCTSTSLDS